MPPETTTTTSSRTHHFFLVRHCVRSTTKHVYCGQNQVTKEEYSINPGDYMNVDHHQLPDWGVPEEWCTEDSLAQIRNTGIWLATQGFLKDFRMGPPERQRRIHVEMITDAVQRDVDTAFALAQGLAEGFQQQQQQDANVVVDGLSELHYDHWLFKPTQEGGDPITQLEFRDNDNNITSSSSSSGSVCQATYTNEEVYQQIKANLASMPPPTSFSDALEFIMTAAGMGVVGNLSSYFANDDDDISPTNFNNLSNNNKTSSSSLPLLSSFITFDNHMTGIPELLKYVAEMAFYTRAGNIVPPFLPDLTPDQVYDFLQWVHWTRSITNKNTARQATQGAALAQALLQVLNHGSIHPANRDDNDDNDPYYDSYVTIVVGHDGNLDDLATSLGAAWVGPSPYRSGPVVGGGGTSRPDHDHRTTPNASGSSAFTRLPVTPPLSGIYARRDTTANQIDVGFLCPVYNSEERNNNHNNTNNALWIWNGSGILEQVPLEWNTTTTVDDSSIQHNDNNRRPKTTEDLQQQIWRTLESYTGARDCLEATREFLFQTNDHNHEQTFPHQQQQQQRQQLVPPLPILILTAVVIIINVGAACTCFINSRDRHHSRNDLTVRYEEVKNEEVELI